MEEDEEEEDEDEEVELGKGKAWWLVSKGTHRCLLLLFLVQMWQTDGLDWRIHSALVRQR